MKLGQKLAIIYIKAKLHILALASPRKAAREAFRIFCTPRKQGVKKYPPVFEAGQRLSFRLDGHTIRGYKWAPEGGGIPVKRILILHGFDSSIRKFDHFIEAFRSKGYEVFGFDAPAHGFSSGNQINLPLYSAMIDKIAATFGPFQGFLAHSFGGAALALSLEHIPHSPETRVALVAPATETTTSIDKFCQFLELSQEVRLEFYRFIEKKAGHPAAYYSIRRSLLAIHAAILWVHDQDDDITPLKDVLLVKEDHPPSVRFLFTRGLGHRKIYRDPEIVKELVDYL